KKNVMIGVNHTLLETDVEIRTVVIYIDLTEVRKLPWKSWDRISPKIEMLASDIAVQVVSQAGSGGRRVPGRLIELWRRQRPANGHPIENLSIPVDCLHSKQVSIDSDPEAMMDQPELAAGAVQLSQPPHEDTTTAGDHRVHSTDRI